MVNPKPCELCGERYEADAMVAGWEMLDGILNRFNLDYRDRFCLPCYELEAVKEDK